MENHAVSVLLATGLLKCRYAQFFSHIELIQKASHERFSHEKAKQLQEAATNSFGVKFAKDVFSFQLRQMISQIKFIEDRLSGLEAEISQLLLSINNIITTITEIGDVLGEVIVAEIGDISRFDSAPKLVAFAGLDVSVKQSGEVLGT